MRRAIAVVVITLLAALAGLLAGGAWSYRDDVCEGLARLRALTDRVGDVRTCACAVVDTLRRAEPDAFVFDVTGDHGVARVVVRSTYDVAAGVKLFGAVTVITRDEDVVIDADDLEAL